MLEEKALRAEKLLTSNNMNADAYKEVNSILITSIKAKLQMLDMV